jgi:S1-C subfamily serine protease
MALAGGTGALAGGSGSGVVIGAHGEILTNNHVVKDCAFITVAKLSSAYVVARDEANDLAVVRPNAAPPAGAPSLLSPQSVGQWGGSQAPIAAPFSSVAAFRKGPMRAGDGVVALGYPLSGLLATAANLTVGNVSATAGLNDDLRELQISAPVQPGNSGGPLLDMSGRLAGIVTSQINALKIAEATGDIPQNINFAIKAEVARAFLDANGIRYRSEASEEQRSAAEVGEIGRPFTVFIECKGSSAPRSPGVAGSANPSPSAPPSMPVLALPACESAPVKSELIKIGYRRGVAVFNILSASLVNAGDMEMCAALALTSAGKLAVAYTVSWANRQAGLFWVQVTSYRRTW